MKCNNCGAELLNGAKICYRCGASQVEPPPTRNTKYCQHCGSLIDEECVVCPKCGKQVAELRVEQPVIIDQTPNVVNSGIQCPRCGSYNVIVQREQTGSIGAFQNKATVMPAKESKGCLYWMMVGWWVKPMKFAMFDWWYRPLFGGKRRGGINFTSSKTLNRTIAVCQYCGKTWKI